MLQVVFSYFVINLDFKAGKFIRISSDGHFCLQASKTLILLSFREYKGLYSTVWPATFAKLLQATNFKLEQAKK